MKIIELLEGEEEQSVLLTAIKAAKKRGDRVAWYARSGDRSVPVWIVDWRLDERTFEDGKAPAIIFRGNKGYHIDYKTIRLSTMDDNWTLLPGKTKNTFWLKRDESSLKEGMGDSVMAFTDWLENATFMKKDDRAALEKVATMLFKAGWYFDRGDSNSDFTFRLGAESFRIVVPASHHNKRDHGMLTMQYHTKGRFGNETRSIAWFGRQTVDTIMGYMRDSALAT